MTRLEDSFERCLEALSTKYLNPKVVGNIYTIYDFIENVGTLLFSFDEYEPKHCRDLSSKLKRYPQCDYWRPFFPLRVATWTGKAVHIHDLRESAPR